MVRKHTTQACISCNKYTRMLGSKSLLLFVDIIVMTFKLTSLAVDMRLNLIHNRAAIGIKSSCELLFPLTYVSKSVVCTKHIPGI